MHCKFAKSVFSLIYIEIVVVTVMLRIHLIVNYIINIQEMH